ncbi:MAG: leucyl aminopeptidase family protein, partial [Planctomycetota bacterium]
GAFRFTDFKGAVSNGEGKAKAPTTLRIHAAGKTVQQQLALGLQLAEAANYARNLAATPPNVATTTRIASEARKIAAGNPRIRCNVYKGADLKKHKLVGLENVGKASENPPCLIEFIYTPAGKKPKDTLMVVGKTIAYDTGGLSLKINNGMKGMKYDKCGGMAVLGFVKALAAIKPGCRVVALMPTAENSISDEAYRPDDILTYLNGVTVEVTNTDAEGRLVLADALAWGEKKHKPSAIVDLATLTGGVVVALGSVHAGLWCDDDKLRGRLDDASAASGERLWRLPHHPEYNDMMKASHADIHNSAPVRAAHPIQGAAFLSYFVNENTPWAHIDIAGTADLEKPNALFPAGPTGFGVRLLASLAEKWK